VVIGLKLDPQFHALLHLISPTVVARIPANNPRGAGDCGLGAEYSFRRRSVGRPIWIANRRQRFLKISSDDLEQVRYLIPDGNEIHGYLPLGCGRKASMISGCSPTNGDQTYNDMSVAFPEND
jgi:hypothetical protein